MEKNFFKLPYRQELPEEFLDPGEVVSAALKSKSHEKTLNYWQKFPAGKSMPLDSGARSRLLPPEEVQLFPKVRS
jgi:hypothetical protein